MACGAALGQGEGSGATGSVYNVFATPTASETAFEWPEMPKRCRRRRDSILDALQEEELVADTQPELVSTNPEDDLEVRASKRRKTADHYRSKLHLYVSLPIATGPARSLPSPSCAGAVNFPDAHKKVFFLVATVCEEVL